MYFRFHKEISAVLIILFLLVIFFYFIYKPLFLIFLILLIFTFYFFRDPERVVPLGDDILVSPADGLITDISERTGPIELQLENKSYTRISIFMNVFNCHVNRTPLTGTVEEINYKPGKFLNASLDKASEENERNYYKIKCSKSGEEIIIVQIAGLIARRIVCEVEQGQSLKQGDRIGMIRFGSRVDIYFKNKKVLAKIGQNVVAGESLIASEW